MNDPNLILEVIQQVRDRLAEHVEETRTYQRGAAATIERIDHTLRGNGTPGLTTRMDRVEQRAALVAKVAWWALGIGGTIAGGIVVKLTLF